MGKRSLGCNKKKDVVQESDTGDAGRAREYFEERIRVW